MVLNVMCYFFETRCMYVCMYVYFIIAKSAKWHKHTVEQKIQHKKAVHKYRVRDTIKNQTVLKIFHSSMTDVGTAVSTDY